MRLLSIISALLLSIVSYPLAAEEVTLDHQGITLNANLSAATDDWQKGTVVLMTHGTLAHRGMEIMSGLQNMFKERGVTSLAINLGYNINNRPAAMYDCPTPHTHKHTDALDEIGAWLGWLKSQGANKVALLGHSRGGNQAAWFAAEHPDPAITHVFLIAPSVPDQGYGSKDYEKRYKQALEPVLKKAQGLVDAGKGNTMIDTGFIYCDATKATAEAFVAEYKSDPRRNTANIVKNIQAPVIVFAGSEDKVVKGLVEKMEPMADGEKIRLEVADGADHFFRDLYSEDIADIIAEELGVE
jgi:pimeloyl-ACP methyl ester carboxylesterase